MNAVVQFQAPRLPFHDLIEERFNVDKGAWKVLVESVFPSAKTPDAVVMALSYCKRRNLDIFKRPVHIVPMYSSATGGYVETVWPGISELRTTAFRTSQYAGCDETIFGPDLTRKFEGTVGRGQYEQSKTIEVTFPEWGRMTVWRMVGGVRVPFVGPKVYWLESYGKIGKSDLPNDMWAKRSRGQLEKCVEAAALRKTFPEEIGNELTAEEMAGQTIIDNEAPAEQLKLVPPSAPKVPPTPSEVIHVPESRQGRMPLPKDDEAGIPDHMRSEHDMAAQTSDEPSEGDDTPELEEPASEAPAAAVEDATDEVDKPSSLQVMQFGESQEWLQGATDAADLAERAKNPGYCTAIKTLTVKQRNDLRRVYKQLVESFNAA